MCDFSLQAVRSRPAKVGDKLTTRDFGTGTRGFAGKGQDQGVAVCVLPGTELALASGKISSTTNGRTVHQHGTAIFRQINLHTAAAHHDALEFPDGKAVLLTILHENQDVEVLQLPAAPKNESEAKAQSRLEVVG
jgi:hypothetical protein